ncbi:MAG: hypothetical protein IPM98_17950 [Lewinellaceae bacterium]|nr:hypothetical protein [Lewinellaceae bacterium]
MNLNTYLQQFSQNTVAFVALFSGTSEDEYLWRPAPVKWCLPKSSATSPTRNARTSGTRPACARNPRPTHAAY